MKIGHKLPLIMGLIAVVALYLAEYIASTNARAALLAAGQERLQAVAQSRAAEIAQRLRFAQADLQAKANNPVMVEALRAFMTAWPQTGVPPDGEAGDDRLAGLLDFAPYRLSYLRYHAFFENHAASHGYQNIFIVSSVGQVIYAVNADRLADVLDRDAPGADSLAKVVADLGPRRERAPTSSVWFSQDMAADQTFSAFIAAPIRSETVPRSQGVVIFQVGSRVIEQVAKRPEGIGKTGSVSVLRADRRTIVGDAGALDDWILPEDQLDTLLARGGLASITTADNRNYIAAIAVFPFGGVDYSVVVQQLRDEVLAPAIRLRRETLRDGVPALGLVCVLGVLLARSISVPLDRVGRAMSGVARRAYEREIPGRNRADEIGQIARRLDLFRASLVKADAVERENAFKSAAFEGASSALMILDTDFTIIYVNDCLVDLMRRNHIALGRNVPDFRVDALPGRNLSAFFPGTPRLREVASGGPRREELSLGHVHLTLDIGPVRGRDSQTLLGYVVEWTDMTVQRLNLAVIAAVNSALPICSFTTDGRLIESNGPFSCWSRLSESALSGIHWNALFCGVGGVSHPSWDEILQAGHHNTELVLAPNAAPALPCTLSRITTEQGRLLRFVLSAGRIDARSVERDFAVGHTHKMAAGT
ncbi:MAG: HAMP domain-containing protein [Pseudomonadota bacterium]